MTTPVEYLLLLSSIAAGAVTVLGFRLDQRGPLKLLNAFTGSYLLCLTFLHLLPELYAGGHAADEATAVGRAEHLVGILILTGFFVQVILDSISLGVEHGHTHSLGGRIPIGVLAGLCLHAFIEAMALGNAADHHDPASRRMLLWSIVIHNYPVSIALLAMLRHAGLPRGKALALLAVFAAMAPLGMTLSAHTELARHTRELTAIVIGIFMHIGTTILFEASDAHRFNQAKIVAILLGAALGGLTVAFH